MAECLVALLGRLHILLKSQDSDEQSSLAAEMGCTLSILQGMCLTNSSSKQICSRRSTLELLLTIVSADYSQSSDPTSPLRLLAPHAIDTLMCVLVDASSSTRRAFEQAHGLSIIRRVMNAHPAVSGPSSASGSSDLDVTGSKCFEFLLFYLQTKSFEEQAASQHPDTPDSLFKPPETPKPKRGHGRSKSAITATPFNAPMATPQLHHRVLSYGSPTKNLVHSRTPISLDINPFMRAQERAQSRAKESEQSELLTPRAQPRILDRENSPSQRSRRRELAREPTQETRRAKPSQEPSSSESRW